MQPVRLRAATKASLLPNVSWIARFECDKFCRIAPSQWEESTAAHIQKIPENARYQKRTQTQDNCDDLRAKQIRYIRKIS